MDGAWHMLHSLDGQTTATVVLTEGLMATVTQHEPGAHAWKQRQGEDALHPSVIKYSMAAWWSSFWCCPCLHEGWTWMPPWLLWPPRRGNIWYQLRGAQPWRRQWRRWCRRQRGLLWMRGWPNSLLPHLQSCSWYNAMTLSHWRREYKSRYTRRGEGGLNQSMGYRVGQHCLPEAQGMKGITECIPGRGKNPAEHSRVKYCRLVAFNATASVALASTHRDSTVRDRASTCLCLSSGCPLNIWHTLICNVNRMSILVVLFTVCAYIPWNYKITQINLIQNVIQFLLLFLCILNKTREVDELLVGILAQTVML